jgi:Flp pilus assembly protein TadD
MGDLRVRVCMGDYVVDDRTIKVSGVVHLGDCLDARVAFPGTKVAVIRLGDTYRLRGRTLEEGEELRITLGHVDVWVGNEPKYRRIEGQSSLVDHKFVMAATIMIAVGSWVDAAEAWIDHQPAVHTQHAGSTLKRMVTRVRQPATRQRVAAVRAHPHTRTEVEHIQRIADGPRHISDDRATRTAFYRWYRSAVPSDPLARKASQRLEQDEMDGAARRTLANAAYNADRFESAAWHYQMLTWANQDDGGALLGFARSQRRRGRHASEIEVYRRILESWQDHAAALGGMATALARMGRFDEAALSLERLETVSPEDPYTDMAIATIAALEGRSGDALDALNRAVSHRQLLSPELQIELRRDIALDPAFSALRHDKRLRGLLRRHLGAAAPRTVR